MTQSVTINIPHLAVKDLSKPRSSSYKFSVNADDSGEAIYKQVKADAKIFNAEQRLMKMKDPNHKKQRKIIARFARLGKDSPHAHNYRGGRWNAYQRIDWIHAASFDIYETLQTESSAHWTNWI